ncbi:unnamed protein product [Plutella xylostella]|uniref:(diamondback moth) hypothetical protein n=1 Tax=Plutella xylostella TaxID=51655 RepID=A0A8S4DD46_PLUXY|nr:unnamed protein product [Plutella xylostella]
MRMRYFWRENDVNTGLPSQPTVHRSSCDSTIYNNSAGPDNCIYYVQVLIDDINCRINVFRKSTSVDLEIVCIEVVERNWRAPMADEAEGRVRRAPAPPPRQAARPPEPRPRAPPAPPAPCTALAVRLPAPPRLIRPSEHLALVQRRQPPPLTPAVTVVHHPLPPPPPPHTPAHLVHRSVAPPAPRMPAPRPVMRLPQPPRAIQTRRTRLVMSGADSADLILINTTIITSNGLGAFLWAEAFFTGAIRGYVNKHCAPMMKRFRKELMRKG